LSRESAVAAALCRRTTRRFFVFIFAAKEQVEGMSKLRKQLDRFLLKKPKLGKGVYIARGAAVLGDVTLGDYSSVWYNAVLRGDINRIVVGHHTNVQDNAVLHLADDFPCIVGNYVTIGHSAVVHACTVGDEVLVGMGAIILDGAVIGRQSIIGAKALVTQGTKIPPGSLVLGAPAKVMRALTRQERAGVKYWAQKYVENSAYCLKNGGRISVVSYEEKPEARVGRSRMV
jgi:carbonic anhydrase/acetyltransferase-like protein (isoleucine patch superfamily)